MEAWHEGARAEGIQPDELSPTEQHQRNLFIVRQFSYVFGLATFIQQNSKANGGKWSDITNRLELWANQWKTAYTEAQMLAAADKKKKWELGATERHCRSCAGFNGRVYRASTWRNNGAYPRSQQLECGGIWHCDCNLVDTDERMTPGPFPTSLLG